MGEAFSRFQSQFLNKLHPQCYLNSTANYLPVTLRLCFFRLITKYVTHNFLLSLNSDFKDVHHFMKISQFFLTMWNYFL